MIDMRTTFPSPSVFAGEYEKSKANSLRLSACSLIGDMQLLTLLKRVCAGWSKHNVAKLAYYAFLSFSYSARSCT